MKRSVALSVGAGLAIAVVLLASLEASDVIFQSRLLPWVLPLIYLQEAGFRLSAHLFPCQKEGFDTGCEAYKRLPTFVGANALLYSIILLPVFYFRRTKANAERQTSKTQILPPNIRLLAAATSCVTGIALLGISWILSLIAIFPILGAVVAVRFPRSARWLVLPPSLFLSILVLPIFFANLIALIKDPFGGPHDFNFLAVRLSWLLSPLLLILCDTALVIDIVKCRRAPN
ncbi:MAG TPA: hypothetical protein VGK36_10165 [Candidatus Angelobacter sp.]|jgi:hypothetical protein